MKAGKFITVASVVLGALASSARAADNIAINQWYTAGFDGDAFPTTISTPLYGPPPVDAFDPASVDAPVAPWTITLLTPATLEVVDLEVSGDRFQMFDGINSLGDTSVPNFQASSEAGLDIDVALGDPNYSNGSFSLGAGPHSLSGILLPGSLGYGVVAFEVTPGAVPEPASLGVLGLGAVALLARRRKAARA